MKKARLLSLSLATVMAAASLAGCGSAKEESAVKTTPAASATAGSSTNKFDKSVELTWWEYPNYGNVKGMQEGEYEKQMVAAFNKKYPNIKINVEMIAFATGPEKINVAIATNTKPDFTYDFPGRIIDYGRQGALVPLDDMLTPDVRKDLDDKILKFCGTDGKTYMYPSTTTPFLMSFNKTLFEKIGALDLLPLNKPDRAWTVAEYEKALTAVKEKAKGVFPSVFYCKTTQGDPSTRFYIMNLGGTDVINDQQNAFVINNDKGVAGLQWVMDKYKSGLIAPGAEAYTSGDAIDMYLQGKAASCIIYSPVLQATNAAKKPTQFEEVFLPWPTQPGEKPRVEVSVYGECVFDNKNADKATAAKLFIDFMNNDPEWGPKNVRNNGGFPAKKSLAGMYDAPELKYAESMTQYATDSALTVPRWAEMRTHWFPVLQTALLGKTTAKESLDKFVKEANEVINRK